MLFKGLERAKVLKPSRSQAISTASQIKKKKSSTFQNHELFIKAAPLMGLNDGGKPNYFKQKLTYLNILNLLSLTTTTTT